MVIFETIERLINEHGSAAILREQLGLLKAQQAALEAKNSILQAQLEQLQAANLQLEQTAGYSTSQLAGLSSGNPENYCCDHCGSPALQRSGSRLNAQFSEVGIKDMLFICKVCQRETAVIEVR